MTAANRSRRSFWWAAVLGIGLAAGLVPSATAEDAPPPLSRLETPMADLAVLDPPPGAPAGTTPMLLVLDAEPIGPSIARLSILQRRTAWDRIAVLDVDLGQEGLTDRWLIGLGDGRFALIATVPRAERGPGQSMIVGIEAAGLDGAPTLAETSRATLARAVEDTGAADVDGLGTPELAVGLRPETDTTASCATSSLMILDPVTMTVRRSIEVHGHLGHGVIGRWDVQSGDDLLAAADCPPSDPRLVTIRLRDGTQATVPGARLAADISEVPPPLRVRLTESGPDRALVVLQGGVVIVDGVGGTPLELAEGPAIPLVAGADPGPVGGAVRVAWLDAAGIHTLRLGATKDGSLTAPERDVLEAGAIGADRWELLTAGTTSDIRTHGVSSAWLGDFADDGCQDLVLPGAIEPCGSDRIRPGAMWLATRLVTVMPIDGRRTALIAAGLDWDPRVSMPASPTPWASAPAGWWRHGPSTVFVLSETRGSDALYFRDFPVPKATIEATTARDGTTSLAGFTGTRLFTTVQPLADDEEASGAATTKLGGLLRVPGPEGVVRTVRVPVPPGNESGRDGSFTTLPMGDIRKEGPETTTRWSVQVVAINDWGEVGAPVAGTVARDALGPTLNLEVPFTSPVWPFLARLPGRAEPGSTVSVEGGAPLDVDARGRFTFVTHLAPWPQTIRLAATDASGNTSIGEFSIVGGIDYRRFPWALITALILLGAVAVRGLMVAGRRSGAVEATPWSLGTLDEDAMPEIEELAPGKGLARKRTPVE